MADDPLKRLLDEADVAPTAPSVSPRELANDVRVLFQRRRRRNRVIATTGILLIGMLLWQGVLRMPVAQRDQPLKAAGQVAESKHAGSPAGLGQVMKQIDREQRIVEQLLAAERRQRLAMTAQKMEIGPERQAQFDEQVARAALAILVPADQKRLRPGLHASAGNDYESVIGLFPRTQWADTAKQRLASLDR